jgi:hypothetical protein
MVTCLKALGERVMIDGVKGTMIADEAAPFST